MPFAWTTGGVVVTTVSGHLCILLSHCSALPSVKSAWAVCAVLTWTSLGSSALAT